MKPYEIRAELIRNQVTNTSLAAELGITQSAVSIVISGRGISARIRAAIAAAINRPVSEIWPDAKEAI